MFIILEHFSFFFGFDYIRMNYNEVRKYPFLSTQEIFLKQINIFLLLKWYRISFQIRIWRIIDMHLRDS